MNNPTNESNEAYERRVAAGKLLVDAPQGARFEYGAAYDIWRSCAVDEVVKFALHSYPVRIAPTPKKVLKRWVEIFQLEAKHPERTFLSLGVIALAKENLDKMVGKTREEIPGAETFPEEWFMEPKR